jgi:hypothetical protein
MVNLTTSHCATQVSPLLGLCIKNNEGNWKKMRSDKKSLALMSAVMMSLTLAACGGGGGGTDAPAVDTPVTTSAVGVAKMRFFNQGSCYSNQNASLGNTVLATAQNYNKSNSALMDVPAKTDTVTVTYGTKTVAALKVDLKDKNTYTVLSTNTATEDKLLLAESSSFEDKNRFYRTRVINASPYAVNVYLVPEGAKIPATPTFSVTQESPVSLPTINAVTADKFRLYITKQGDAAEVLFDSNTADLQMVAGDDLSIVVPPFGLCAGKETIRVNVLNDKPDSVVKTIVHNEATIGTISTTTGSAQISFYMEGETLNVAKKYDLRTSIKPIKMDCSFIAVTPTEFVQFTKTFTQTEKGIKYDLSATCPTTSRIGEITYKVTNLGDYGN